ncbi:nucleotidyltransferase domain-containing protein [Rhodoferax lacus]|uniref:Nucleotidyltransferase domain-containing protein n=1 Tax=Rhodoferax lacus TaxID=2184758 RepID=A0A3E1R750_9BURK|nr:nucleotidyltransferase domain-containing protein [Rhodoferax lacus]RFO95198.1 nucleotidyltransferase domain-containing protein [Rhodoferax lacus]
MLDLQASTQKQTTARAAHAGLVERLLQSNGPVVQALRNAFPSVLAVYAFGSQMAGTARTDSDLDLAVLVAGYADPLVLWELSHKLADLAGCPVDLLDLRAASTVMQYQVLTQGQRLWAKGLEADLFACFVMGEKLALDAARAGTLADIARDGRVYGR